MLSFLGLYDTYVSTLQMPDNRAEVVTLLMISASAMDAGPVTGMTFLLKVQAQY